MLYYGLGYKSGCYVIGLGGGVILGSYINVTPTVVGMSGLAHEQQQSIHQRVFLSFLCAAYSSTPPCGKL